MRDALRALRVASGLVAEADRDLASRIAVLGVVDALRAPVAALLIKVFLDAAVEGRPGALLLGGACLALVLFAGTLANVVSVDLRARLQEKTGLRVDQNLVDIIGRLQRLDHHHDPEFADRLAMVRARRDSLGTAVESLVFTMRLSLTLGMTALLLMRMPLMLLILVVSSLPPVVTSTVAGRWRAHAVDATARGRRQAAHLVDLATGAEAAAEVRVDDLRAWLTQRHAAVWKDVERRLAQADVHAAILRVAGLACSVGGYAAGMTLVLAAAGRGELSLGDVSLAAYLGVQFGGQVSQTTAMMTSLARTLQMASQYRWLRDHVDGTDVVATATRSVPTSVAIGLCVQGVTYAYPGASTSALREVSFSAPAGSLVALVGENGAGKSTLVNLLCGLYRSTAGRIVIGGVDIEDFGVWHWRTRATAAFQDFATFELVARETIGIGNLACMHADAHVYRAIQRADAASLIDNLPNSIDTQLGASWPGGVDLSHGMWQKMAIARAFMRESPLLCILDEPASALDPLAEEALVTEYIHSARELGARCGGVSIVVSHRLSTVRAADLIVILDEGTVVETGTHDELIEHNGHYAALYALYAGGYAEQLTT